MLRLPQPTAAWPLDGTSAAAYGGAAATLHGACAQPWTEGPTNGSKALRVARSCYASVDNAPSLALGAGSLSACVRLRTSTLGATLLAKLRVGAAGFAVEVAEGGRGLGVALADTLGEVASSEEEMGPRVAQLLTNAAPRAGVLQVALEHCEAPFQQHLASVPWRDGRAQPLRKVVRAHAALLKLAELLGQHELTRLQTVDLRLGLGRSSVLLCQMLRVRSPLITRRLLLLLAYLL